MSIRVGIVASIVLAGCVLGGAPGSRIVLAQKPVPPGTPVPTAPKLSLVPLKLISASVDGVAKGITSINNTPLPTPEFTVPRTVAKTIGFTTQDAIGTVKFSHTLPSGVPASAFAWESETVAAGAQGRLRYNGCASCPATITIGVHAADTQHAADGQVRLTLTASTGRPAGVTVTNTGGSAAQPEFQIRFTAGTFDLADSQIIATYAGGLKYRLLPDRSSNIAQGTIVAVIPRLKVDRNVQVALSNVYGAGTANVTLPAQPQEAPGPFECVNCSDVLNPATVHDTFSVKHTNNGPLDASGSDDVTITPLQPAAPACDQVDFVYTGAAVSWINPDTGAAISDVGTVAIASQPPANSALRAPQNVVHVTWTLKGLKGERWFQVAFRGVDVVGVCSNRVVQ